MNHDGCSCLDRDDEHEDDETANQTLCIKPVRDHLSVLWDPFAQDRTKADARYCFVYERIPLADFKAQYPDAQTDGFDTTTNATRNMTEGWWDGEYVTVAEYWWVETKKARKAFFKDGRTINDIDAELDDDAREQATKDAKRVRTIETKKIFSRLMNGSEFLTEPTEQRRHQRAGEADIRGVVTVVGDHMLLRDLLELLRQHERTARPIRHEGPDVVERDRVVRPHRGRDIRQLTFT